MKRRKFIQNTTIGTALSSFFPLMAVGNHQNNSQSFNLDYAPHFGMFKNHAGNDLVKQIDFMADQGFRSLEDNGMMARSIDDQKKISIALERRGMRMGVFVIDGGDNWKVSLATGKQEFIENFVNTCNKAVEIAKRTNTKWMTVVPGYFERNLPMGIQTGNVIDALKRGVEVLEPHDLVMVLEPLSDNPDLFLRFSDQTYSICKAIGSPSCKILYDVYHMQRNEGNVIANMEKCWSEIAYLQVGDNPGRKEPGTGELNYKNIFKFIDEKGYQGVIGMEHGVANTTLAGEKALIDAYRSVDNFKSNS
jgi:hydroxypyruvate isomerase